MPQPLRTAELETGGGEGGGEPEPGRETDDGEAARLGLEPYCFCPCFGNHGVPARGGMHAVVRE